VTKLDVARAWWLNRALGRKFLVKRIHDYEMRLPIDPRGRRGLPETLIRHDVHEPDQVRIVRRELGAGAVAADIGANIGYYALLEASLVGPAGRVYAIEPSSENLDLLRHNITRNRKADIIDTFHLGVSDRAGQAPLYLSALRNCHAFMAARPHPVGRDAGSPETEMVSVQDFSSFAEGKRPINLVRMDVEGYEVQVLRGMQSYIARTNHDMRILFEVHRSRYDDRDFNMREQLAHLFQRGFVAKTLVAKPLVDSKPWGRAPFSSRGYSPDFVMAADGVERAFFSNVSPGDTADFVCEIGCVRALLLARPAA
jgi:FkbM family methyltransferase